MWSFLVRRTVSGVVVLLAVSLLVFALFYVTPNDVARTIAGRHATPETVALVEHRLGLDEPLWRQYTRFVSGALKGDLGYDYYHQVPVTEVLRSAAPVTVSLALGAALLWLALGISGGVVAAVRQHSRLDRSITMLCTVGYSVPPFVLGLLLLYWLYFRPSLAGIELFPAGGYAPLRDGVGAWAQHLALPWVTLAAMLVAPYTRLVRGSLIEALRRDHIRTARAKGLPGRRVVVRHGLRTALTPAVSQFGVDLGTIVGGVVVVETVFSLPGLGKVSVDAINEQNLPVITGTVLVASATVVVVTLLTDLLYAVLDPRVRLS
jgi:peptide/nickel transport system permease protein